MDTNRTYQTKGRKKKKKLLFWEKLCPNKCLHLIISENNFTTNDSCNKTPHSSFTRKTVNDSWLHLVPIYNTALLGLSLDKMYQWTIRSEANALSQELGAGTTWSVIYWAILIFPKD